MGEGPPNPNLELGWDSRVEVRKGGQDAQEEQ